MAVGLLLLVAVAVAVPVSVSVVVVFVMAVFVGAPEDVNRAYHDIGLQASINIQKPRAPKWGTQATCGGVGAEKSAMTNGHRKR